MIEDTTEFYNDLNTVVVYTTDTESENSFVKFRAYEFMGWDDKDNYIYESKGSKNSDDVTTDLDDAQTIIEGIVKFDGCSHCWFGDKEGYIHLCGRENILNISRLIKKIYFRCGQLMERSSEEEFASD